MYVLDNLCVSPIAKLDIGNVTILFVCIVSSLYSLISFKPEFACSVVKDQTQNRNRQDKRVFCFLCLSLTQLVGME